MDRIFLAVVVAFLLLVASLNFGSALFPLAAFGIAVAVRLDLVSKTLGTVPILRNLRNKMGLSPAAKRF